MHVRSADPASVRLAIDQCAEVGFEMVIMTFGSGFNFESRDPAYQAQIKELADYAAVEGHRARRLLAAGQPRRGHRRRQHAGRAGALRRHALPGRAVGHRLSRATQELHRQQPASACWSTTAPIPATAAPSTNHPGHRGLDDSQWVQWRAITDFYKWCRANGVYLNIPDWYFLTGGNKTGMGYRETNWSLPRAQQEIIERQNIFDGTWEKTPRMGWMFVPLTAVPRRRRGGHHRAAERAPAALRAAPGQPVRRGRAGLLPRPAALRHRRNQGAW